MTANAKIAELPQLLLAAIRNETWQGTNPKALRPLVRLVNDAAHIGLPTLDLLVVLAVSARNSMPVPNTDWTNDMRKIESLIWPFLAGSIGLRDTVRRTYGNYSTIDEALTVARRYVEDERAKLFMSEADADQAIRAEMARVALLYPNLNLSFGYIGNLWWGPYRDDRWFRVFTTLATPGCFGGCDVHFGDHGALRLGELAHIVEMHLAAWAATTSARLDAGELRQVRQRALAPE